MYVDVTKIIGGKTVMKKRLISIALALAVSLAFASGAFASVLPVNPSGQFQVPATPMYPAPGGSGYPTSGYYPVPATPLNPATPPAAVYPSGTVIPATPLKPATPASPSYPAGTVIPATPLYPAAYPSGTVIPATPLYPANYPSGTVLPATPLYPAYPRVLTPNPLPRDAKPLPPPYSTNPPYGLVAPHAYDKVVMADVAELVNRLAVKYNANPKELYRYIFISDASFDRLDSGDKAQLKKLMVKMAAKAMGISVSKLNKELDDIESEMISRHMKRTGAKKAEARKYVREHAHNSLFYGAR